MNKTINYQLKKSYLGMITKEHIYAILGIQVVTSIALDSYFLSDLDFSLQLGVNGIAYSNAIASFITLTYAITVFSRKMGMSISDWKENHDYSWMESWWNVGKYSGLDSFVRNIFYMIFIFYFIFHFMNPIFSLIDMTCDRYLAISLSLFMSLSSLNLM